MGKKRSVIIGSEEEEKLKAKKAVKLEQKKLREGEVTAKPLKTPKSESSDLTPATESPKATSATLTPDIDGSPKTKAGKAPKTRSKNYLQAKSQVDVAKLYKVSDALELLRKVSYSKTNDTVELHIVLKAKPASDLKVNLPHTVGKTKKVAVVTDSVIKEIESGKINFDLLVASPSDMPKLVKFAKILGPKGLMPNPKSGTISDNPEAAAKKLSADTSLSLKLDKSGPVIHTVVGKLALKDQELAENISAMINAASSVGLTKVILKSTMSPAIKLVI